MKPSRIFKKPSRRYFILSKVNEDMYMISPKYKKGRYTTLIICETDDIKNCPYVDKRYENISIGKRICKGNPIIHRFSDFHIFRERRKRDQTDEFVHIYGCSLSYNNENELYAANILRNLTRR